MKLESVTIAVSGNVLTRTMHGHSVNVFDAGSSDTNKNMPSFIAVNVWQRTA